MANKTLFITSLICLLLLGVTTASAQGKKQANVQETFIFLKVNKIKDNSFYRVMVDQNEAPYLNVKEVLQVFLDFAEVSCTTGRPYCSGVMMPNKTRFWVDGVNGFLGNSEGEEASFDKSSLVQVEGEYWLKYDVWSQWLPAEFKWDLARYGITVSTKFKLLSERRKEIEDGRKNATMMKRQRESLENVEAITSEDLFNPTARYRLGYKKRPRQSSEGSVEYNVNVDMFTGTLNGGQIMQFPFDDQADVSAPYGTYSFRNRKHFYLMEAGTTSFQDVELLLPNVSSEYGFRFDQSKRDYSEGKISVTDLAPANTDVDLYIDGIYVETQRVGSNGTYNFTDLLVSSSTSIKLKLFYPDGTEEEKVIPVARDNGLKLKPGTFDTRAFVGQLKSDRGQLYYGSIRYGVIHNLSVGVSPVMLPKADHAALVTDINYTPLYWLNLLAQGGFSKGSIDRAFRANISLLYPHFFQFEHRYYDQDSPVNYGYGLLRGEYWSGKHLLSSGRWSFSNEYEQYTTTRKFTSKTRFNLSRVVKPSVSVELNWPRSYSMNANVETALSFNITSTVRTDVSRIWSNYLSRTSLLFSVRSKEVVGGWIVNSRFIVDDYGNRSFNLDALYRATKNIQIGALMQQQYFGVQVYWNGILAGPNGPDIWEDLGTGTASGNIIRPAIGGEPSKPLEGVSVTIGGKTAETDANGFYRIKGIPSEVKLKSAVDLSSLETNLTTEKEVNYLYFRRGSHIQWSPKILPSVGIDGYILTSDNIPAGTMVQAIKLPEMQLIASGNVDQDDGFFVVEKLTPGNYHLKLDGPEINVPPKPLKIKDTEDWISGIKWRFADGAIVGKNAAASVLDIPEPEVTLTDLKALQNDIAVRIHNAKIASSSASDVTATRRLDIYGRIDKLTDRMEANWDLIPAEERKEGIIRMRRMMNSPVLMRDEMNIQDLQSLKASVEGKMAVTRNEKKLTSYKRLDEVLKKLEADWESKSEEYKAKVLKEVEAVLSALD